VDTYRWLLALHVSGAFLLVGGAVLAAVFAFVAQRSARPSEIALFLGLTRVAVVAIGIGAVLTLVLGLWLVHDRDYSFGDAWIVLAVVLCVVSAGLGSAGGKRDRETRELAERLAAETDEVTPELRARLSDPFANASWGGSACLKKNERALMIWTPGPT
jgi:uncharacterized membrane protein